MEGKSPLFRPRRRKKGSDKMDFKVIWSDSADQINLAEDTDKCYSVLKKE